MAEKPSKTARLAALLATGLLFACPLWAQASSFWQPTLDSARRLAAHTQRPLLLYFHADWCGACSQLEREVLSRPEIADQIRAAFVPVRINVDHFPATARQYGVTALPTTVVLSPNGALLGSVTGVTEPSVFAARLQQVAAAYNRRLAKLRQQGPSTVWRRSSAAANSPSAVDAQATRSRPLSSPGVQSRSAGAPDSSAGGASPFVANSPPPMPHATAGMAGPEAAGTQLPGATGRSSFGDVSSRTMAPAGMSLGRTREDTRLPSAGRSLAQGVSGLRGAPASQGWPSGGLATSPPQASSPSQAAAPRAKVIPAGNPPLGLDGCCPVTLVEQQRWVPGDRRWGAIHRGRTYLFVGPEEQRRFLADPDRYAPVLSGYDVVLAVEQGRQVPGTREHGVFFDGYVYLFADEITLRQFSDRPEYYADQAWRAMGKRRPRAIAGGESQSATSDSAAGKTSSKGWLRWSFKWPPVPPPPPARKPHEAPGGGTSRN